jgi:glucosamine--fructose-6-phosphate aminotransferase (isomerizing)
LIYYATLVAEKKQSADMALIKEIRQNLLNTPAVAEQCISMVEQSCEEIAKVIYKKESVYLLALRESLAIAREAALKIKELNYIHAEAMGACEMKHGPIAMIASDKPKETVVFLFILDNETFPLLMNALDQMHSRKAYIVVVTDCKKKIDAAFEEEAKKTNKQQNSPKYDSIIEIPKLPHVSHLISIIPMQILVEKIAKLKQINPDMPRNLAKTVTV